MADYESARNIWLEPLLPGVANCTVALRPSGFDRTRVQGPGVANGSVNVNAVPVISVTTVPPSV